MNVSNRGAGLPFLQNFKNNTASPRNAQSPVIRTLLKNAEMAQLGKSDAAGAKNETLQHSVADKDGISAFKSIGRITNGSIPVFADAMTLGGKQDYSKENALDKKNAMQLKMDDDFLKAHNITPSTGASGLSQENGISNSTDFIWANIDLSNASSNVGQLRQSVDDITSRYVAMKERITTDFVGEDREANLNRLDQMMNQYKDKLAQNFANVVGGIFEENGVDGEKDQIYKSVLSEIDKKTEQYSEFAKSNKNYADINGGDEAWLSKDSAFMASELRKAMAAAEISDMKGNADFEGYTLDEMEKMQSFANELESYTKYVSGDTKAILTGNETEESLGMKLAELNLKGTVFNEQSGVSDRIKDAVSKSINNFSKTAIQNEQRYMDKWSQLQVAAYEELLVKGEISETDYNEHISAIKKGFTAFDEGAVYKVINEVQDAYQKTGDVGKALMEGAVSAKNAYDSKAKNNDFDGIHRYDSGGSYWNNFFSNTDKHSNNAYMQNQSGRDSIVNSWNDFMGKMFSNSGTFFYESRFSALA